MKYIYIIAAIVYMAFAVIHLLRNDYSAMREYMILAFLFVILTNQAMETEW